MRESGQCKMYVHVWADIMESESDCITEILVYKLEFSLSTTQKGS